MRARADAACCTIVALIAIGLCACSSGDDGADRRGRAGATATAGAGGNHGPKAGDEGAAQAGAGVERDAAQDDPDPGPRALTRTPPMVSGVLWEARCEVAVSGLPDRTEFPLEFNDACSATPDGPVAFLEWLCNEHQATAQGTLPMGWRCECEAALPDNAQRCTTCGPQSACSMRSASTLWYGAVP